MKNTVRSFAVLAAFAAAALCASAQTASQILVVDLGKLFDSHWETEAQSAKLRSDQQLAEQEVDRLNQEGNALVEQYKELKDQEKNPTVTADAKQKATEAAAVKMEEIQRKQNEVQTFTNNTKRSLQTRINNFKATKLDDISKLATEIAKKKGAILLLDKSGPSLLGVPSVLFADAKLDITEEVQAEINKTKPATPAPAATPAAAPAAAPAAPAKN